MSLLTTCGLFPAGMGADLTQVGSDYISFSQGSGFYTTSVTVALTTPDPDDVIYYTMDGSTPSPNPYSIYVTVPPAPYAAPPYSGLVNYSGGTTYTGPLMLVSTTLIRTRVYRDGVLISGDEYRTYFVDEPTTLPVFSIAVEPAQLWDDATGIYVVGNNPANQVVKPYDKWGHTGRENYRQRWERRAHLEYFDVGQVRRLNMDAGVRIFGGWSRGFEQKSLSVHARAQYNQDSIPYDFFGLTNNVGQSIDSFSSIILRNSGDDWYRTMMRDAMLQSLCDGMDIDRQAYQPSVVFLNGQYWGIHNVREKINEDYLAAHYDYVDAGKVDILESYDSQVVEGNDGDFQNLLSFIAANVPSIPANYSYVETRVDINNLIDYTVAQVFFNNTDWPFSNIKYWRPQQSGGKWRWILFDTDGSFGGKEWEIPIDPNLPTHDTLTFLLAEDGSTDTATLFAWLYTNDTFRAAFKARLAALMSTNFAASSVISQINTLKSVIEGEISRHDGQWGDFWWATQPLPSGWDVNSDGNPNYVGVQIMRDYATAREPYITGTLIPSIP